MRVLIIGDSPTFLGGVTNYTRPLAEHLSNYSKVYYLFNSTRINNNSFFKKTKIIPVHEKEYNFKCFELINGQSVYKNYDNLSNDYSNWFDKIFIKFIDDIKPDAIHINEFFGFSTNVFKYIKERKIKLVITVHEYWWLCPHRVMVDFNKKICDGPTDFNKCAMCVSRVSKNISPEKELFINKIKNNFPKLFNLLLDIRNRKKNNIESVQENINFGVLSTVGFSDEQLKVKIEKRLVKLIEALNFADTIIGVSSDVKRHLIKYGVSEQNILIQHIGSTVAEKTIVHTKVVDSSNIIFGFIGGVGYYKGVHQMVEAFTLLPDELKKKTKLLIYGKYNDAYFNSINKNFIKTTLDKESIKFFGRFTPADLPKITNNIDINILPSLCADTAPQTIFESYSNGLPIIAPKIGGFPDFVQDGVNGLLYEKASVEELRQCMIKIIETPTLINDFSQNIPSCKTMSQNVTELLEIYK